MTARSYDVTCKTGGKTLRYTYDFTDPSVLKRTLVGTGQSRSGVWALQGGKVVVWWEGSPSVESWSYPFPETGTWHGTCTAGPPCTLSAVKIMDLGTFYFRSDEAKEKFLKNCRHARRMFDVAKLKISAFMSALGITYSRAYTQHEKLMNDISAKEKLAEDLLLGFALAFLGGGVGGTVGGIMKAAAASDFMIDGVKDIAKFAVRGPGARIVLAKHNAKMPSNPFEWREGLNERVSTELAFISEQLMAWEEAVENDDVTFAADFDPFQKLSDDLVAIGGTVKVSLFNLPEIDKNDLQLKFQRGWLDGWFSVYGSSVTHVPMSRDRIKDTLIEYGKSIDMPDIQDRVERSIPNERPAFVFPSFN